MRLYHQGNVRRAQGAREHRGAQSVRNQTAISRGKINRGHISKRAELLAKLPSQ